MGEAQTYQIAWLPGDGIGVDVSEVAIEVMQAVASALGITLTFERHAMGGAAIDAYGDPLPDAVLEACQAADAVYLGAVGGPAWDHYTGAMRPESGLLKLRKGLGVYANLRPVVVPHSLAASSPLRADVVADTDMLIVRELTGGIYFGEPRERSGEGEQEQAFNTMVYTREEIARIARVAFDWARKRSGHVTSVDKANVLVVSQLWRDVVTEVQQAEYRDVQLQHLYVDNAAMQVVRDPRQFDVIVTGNLFGDILSDLAATLPGSLGLLPSGSVGGKVGLFEPVHGSAPDIAGQNKANPIAAILSGAMMLDTLGESEAAAVIRQGVQAALDAGNRTGDLWREGMTLATTQSFGAVVRKHALQTLKVASV